MGFVSLGKTNNKNKLSLLGKTKFGENLKFGKSSNPLHYKKMSSKEFNIFKKRLKRENKKIIWQKTILFLMIILFGLSLYLEFYN